MQVTGLDHYNIAAPASLIEQVSRFYCEVLGLTRGYLPAFNSEGYWLYAGERSLVHLKIIQLPPGDLAASKTGWFSHVAFNCVDWASYLARLDALGIDYDIDSVDDLKQVQLFLTDPAGIGVDLNFSESH